MLELKKSIADEASFFVEMERASDTRAFVIPYSLDKHKALIESNDVIYLSIYYEGKLSGFIILSQEGDNTIEFRRVVINNKGKGLGQLAIKAMENYCMENLKCSRIWLDVFESNLKGIHIYKKLGYTKFKESDYEGRCLLFMEKCFFS